MKKYLIGEVCKLFNTTRDTLVYYEKIGLVTPKKDNCNGYRYYTIDDINVLTDIFFLKKLNLPLSDINKAIKNSKPAQVLKMIEEKEKHLKEEMEKLKKLQKTLDSMKSNINSCINDLENIKLKENKESFLFIDITNKSNFNDFIDIMEGMKDVEKDLDIIDKNFLEQVNFSFLINSETLFDNNASKKIKWGATLRQNNNYSQEVILSEKVELIVQKKYMYIVITLDDINYKNWLQKIKDITIEKT